MRKQSILVLAIALALGSALAASAADSDGPVGEPTGLPELPQDPLDGCAKFDGVVAVGFDSDGHCVYKQAELQR